MDRKLYRHPSDALSRGDVDGFLNGVAQLRLAIRYESRWLDTEDEPLYTQRLYAVLDQAREVYLRHVKAAEQTAAAEMRDLAVGMKGHEQEQMDLLALACETGDMSGLAI